MKIRCKFKDPDTMHDAVDAAVVKLPRPEGISQQEWERICEDRAAEAKDDISDLWMEYAEYLDVEFDTDAKTATILPSGSIK